MNMQMLFEIANMLPPKEMQPQKAPPPPPKPICVVTGQPAKYRYTGMHLRFGMLLDSLGDP